MFFKKSNSRIVPDAQLTAAAQDIVATTSEIYATLNSDGLVIKPAASLPSSIGETKQAFKRSYAAGYHSFEKETKEAYHHVFRELSYFLDEPYYSRFNEALGVVVRSRIEAMASKGLKEDEYFATRHLIGDHLRIKTREEVWESFRLETTCPTKDLRYVALTMIHVVECHKLYWDEWSSFANFISATETR